MNKTLIIYDLDGTIMQQVAGFYKTPNGVPYIEVVVPSGKYISGVNVETQEAIFEDIPRSESDIIQEKISILEGENKALREGLRAVLRGDMQGLAYALYPKDFTDINKSNTTLEL